MHQTFFIADTHFGHKNIIKEEYSAGFRPFATVEEHDNELIKRWNSRVRKNDTIWVLGDFCFGEKNIVIANELNGIKKLVLGNHDMHKSSKYLEHFNKLYGAVEYKGLILSHIPVHPCQFYRFKANVHGHMHYKKIDDPRYICVSAEQINLTPISYDEILEKIER